MDAKEENFLNIHKKRSYKPDYLADLLLLLLQRKMK